MEDTQLMAHVFREKVPKAYLADYELRRKELNKTLPKGKSHRPARATSLKVLAPYFLGVEPFWENPMTHDDEIYNEKDCVYTHRLREFFEERMTAPEVAFYKEKMIPWSEMLLEMTLRGILLDGSELERTEVDYADKAEELKERLDNVWADAHAEMSLRNQLKIKEKYREMRHRAQDKITDGDLAKLRKIDLKYEALHERARAKMPEEMKRINYNSPDQMLWLLKEHLGLNVTKVDLSDDDENPDSTGKAVLHSLASKGHTDVALFLEWRKASKILTGFLPRYRELAFGGRLHPTFNITGTRTGRLSSSGPNLQQVPPGLYNVFAPEPGHEFFWKDLSGIEAALIALYSDDKTLYDVIAAGHSPHNFVAKDLFKFSEPVDQIKDAHPVHRQAIKNCLFAVMYGAGWKRIQVVFRVAGIVLTDQEAKRFRDRIKSLFSGVASFHKDVTDIFESKQPFFNLLGRPMAIADREDCYMKGFNTLIQSSASDLNIHSAFTAYARWKQSGLGAFPNLLIHDCVVAQAPKEHAEEADKILVDEMTKYELECKHGRIKLEVEGGRGPNWEK